MTSHPTTRRPLSWVGLPVRLALIPPAAALILIIHLSPALASPYGSHWAEPGLQAAPTPGINHGLYLPLIEKPYPPARPGGSVTLQTGPEACGGEMCYEIEVSCPDLIQTRRATLRVAAPNGRPAVGTILFASGWTGTYYWAGDDPAPTNFLPLDRPDQLLASALENNAKIRSELTQLGYRTVEVKWESSWWDSNDKTRMVGFSRLACRPATVIQWVYDNLHEEGGDAPYCAAGHSNGASQIAYAMSHYEQAGILTAALLESGPNWSRVDQACLHSDPLYAAVFEDLNGRSVIDLGFGQASDSSGSCATQDPGYQLEFEDASLALGDRRFYLPETRVDFILGASDSTTTAAQGQVYYDTLMEAGSPLVSLDIVAGAPHYVTSVEAGMEAVRQTLINRCQ